MPFQLEWFVPQSVMLVTLNGDFTVEEISELSIRIVENLDASGKAPIHILVDRSELNSFPILLAPIRRTATSLNDKRVGWFVLYGKNDHKLLNFLTAMVFKMFGISHQQVETQEQAYTHLLTVDHSLPPWSKAQPYS